jgi:hypothetical protein
MNLELKKIPDSPIKLVFSNGERIGAFKGKRYYKEGDYTHWMLGIINRHHANTLKDRVLGKEEHGHSKMADRE